MPYNDGELSVTPDGLKEENIGRMKIKEVLKVLEGLSYESAYQVLELARAEAKRVAVIPTTTV